MTKYKEYLRAKGYKLENDYECLPYYDTGLQSVTTHVVNNGIVISHHFTMGSTSELIQRDGTAAYEMM